NAAGDEEATPDAAPDSKESGGTRDAESPVTGAVSEESEVEENVEITLGARGVLKEFTEALTGVHSGDLRELSIEYPADYKPERFAGRKVQNPANVPAVRAKELPAVDDDFAQSVDEQFKTVEDLRANLREQLEHASEHQTEEELREAAMAALLELHRFSVPEFLLERQMNSRFQSL